MCWGKQNWPWTWKERVVIQWLVKMEKWRSCLTGVNRGQTFLKKEHCSKIVQYVQNRYILKVESRWQHNACQRLQHSFYTKSLFSYLQTQQPLFRILAYVGEHHRLYINRQTPDNMMHSNKCFCPDCSTIFICTLELIIALKEWVMTPITPVWCERTKVTSLFPLFSCCWSTNWMSFLAPWQSPL